jgi:catalase
MLNPNYGNCFAKIGQAAFNPAHFVPGIGPSPDQMLQGRLFFLPNDTHRCRLGAYHTVLASHHPARSKPANYSRGGSVRTDGDGGMSTRTQ